MFKKYQVIKKNTHSTMSLTNYKCITKILEKIDLHERSLLPCYLESATSDHRMRRIFEVDFLC